MSFFGEKVIGSAMISKSCANYLSGLGVLREIVQHSGWITGEDQRVIHFAPGSSKIIHYYLDADTVPALEVTLARRANSDRAILEIQFQDMLFRETPSGLSKLVLFDLELPDSLRTALRGKRLMDVVGLPSASMNWLIRVNPLVLQVRNVVRQQRYGCNQRNGQQVIRSRKALEINLSDKWAHENWNQLPSADALAGGLDALGVECLRRESRIKDKAAPSRYRLFDWVSLWRSEQGGLAFDDMLEADRNTRPFLGPQRLVYAVDASDGRCGPEALGKS
ncbi:hypothetical protein J3454_15330 [Erythrobacter sp. NFXS35]|uniref:hypothetical protein n=1 Tax=Erythrobacter sp. NFXS35 TaxID=2818436 RepID=UPI0032DECF29